MRIGRNRRIVGLVMIAAVLAALSASATPPASASGVRLTHQQAVSKLIVGDVLWTSSGQCDDRTKPYCTSFDGIWSGTIDGVVNFRKGSTCPVVVTGGTEVGHNTTFGYPYTHEQGYKIDISRTTCVTNFIQRYFTYAGLRGLVQYDKYGNAYRAPMYKNSRGDVYADEYWGDNPHWDILYY